MSSRCVHHLGAALFVHLLALSFLVSFLLSIWEQFKTLAGPPPCFPDWNLVGPGPTRIRSDPTALLGHLFLHMFTQLACVSGVNQLTLRSIAVSMLLNLQDFNGSIVSFVLFGRSIDVGIIFETFAFPLVRYCMPRHLLRVLQIMRISIVIFRSCLWS